MEEYPTFNGTLLSHLTHSIQNDLASRTGYLFQVRNLALHRASSKQPQRTQHGSGANATRPTTINHSSSSVKVLENFTRLLKSTQPPTLFLPFTLLHTSSLPAPSS